MLRILIKLRFLEIMNQMQGGKKRNKKTKRKYRKRKNDFDTSKIIFC